VVRSLIDTTRAEQGYLRILLLDPALGAIYATPGDSPAPSAVTLMLGKKAMDRREVVFSDIYLDAQGRPQMEFLAPVMGGATASGPPPAVLALEVDPYAFLFPLVNSWPTTSKTGETVLVERRGDKVVFLNTTQRRQAAALHLAFPITRTDVPAVKAVRGATGVVTGVDYSGTDVLAAIGPVRGARWFLVSKVDLSEVDAPLRRLALVTIVIVLGVTLLGGAVILFFWSRWRSRDFQRLYEAERELRASEERFKIAFEHAPVGISFTQPDGRMGRVNATLAEMLGYGVAELEGLTVGEITHPGDRAETGRLIKAALAGKIDGFKVDKRYLRKDGSDLWTTASVTLLRDEQGRPVDFVAMISDISARKQAEDARREAERELAEMNVDLERRVLERSLELKAANKELEAFSYSASHDLRAPLRALDGFSLALLEDYGEQLDATGKDHLARVRAAAQRMGQLIDNLLMLSRVTRREMVREKVDLSALARDVLADLREAEPERAVDAAVADGLIANGDPALLRIVLQNLLANAWKFTSRKPEAHIEVGVDRRDGVAAYYVRDDGAGFDATYVDKLFTPFQRLHAADEFPGTGIGLATVKRIVRRHGGSVWAEGAVDCGATFYLTLH
jgi:PAS domain S-box-containing protein